jgi:hypothetical protein
MSVIKKLNLPLQPGQIGLWWRRQIQVRCTAPRGSLGTSCGQAIGLKQMQHISQQPDDKDDGPNNKGNMDEKAQAAEENETE